MKFENTEVWGFNHAIRGMRNPMNSWNKSDSYYLCGNGCDAQFIIGDNDLELAKKLIKGGSEHRKFLRQIFVSVDITAPLYWWKEFDTYKVGTVANSTSTMHKLASTEITLDCFEMGDFEDVNSDYYIRGNVFEHFQVDNVNFGTKELWQEFIVLLEALRRKYCESKDKRYWKELIRLLPESWLQTRTVTVNYENLLAMAKQRKNHKLSEWSFYFMNWLKCLPYSDELLFLEK